MMKFIEILAHGFDGTERDLRIPARYYEVRLQ
jgi:hypothetical protein